MGRINNLTIILKGFTKMNARSSDVEQCMVSMARYVRKSADRSPRILRQQGDLFDFVVSLAFAAVGRADVGALLASDLFDIASIAQEATPAKADQLKRALRRAGVSCRI